MDRRRGLLDTSVIILLERLDGASLPEDAYISTITVGELLVGPRVATSSEERERREAHLRIARQYFTPLSFDEAAALAFSEIATALRNSGKTSHARAFDTLIAAVARAHRLPLYTCNPADFRLIEGLEVVPVPVPAP